MGKPDAMFSGLPAMIKNAEERVMMEELVTIQCKNIRLAGMLEANDAEKAVIVTHPHPLYGGNMDNPVVMQMVASFAGKGFTTLRFNFRGTGSSTGMFDNGVGEQDDLRAAVSHLQALGVAQVVLAGYSFGARVNAGLLSSGDRVPELTDFIMVSPPVGFMSFDDIRTLPGIGLIVTGQADDIAPADMVQTHIHRWDSDCRFEVIPGCDHFYSGKLADLGKILSAYLDV